MPEEIITVRVPELPAVNNDYPLDDNDKMIVHSAIDNKTRHVILSKLRTYLETGGTTPLQPIIDGGTVTYIVPASASGGQIAHIPEVAGLSFNLYRSGQYMIPETNPSGTQPPEFRLLSAGGFQLLHEHDKLWPGERFVLQLYTMVGGSSTVSSGGGGGGSFINGKVLVNTNKTLNAENDIGKVIQIRGGSSKVVVTLPELSTIPDNSIFPFEAVVGNNHQQKIKGQPGQYIYMNNSFFQEIVIGRGESVMMYKDSDGFYVLGEFPKIYREVGKINQAHFVDIDELQCMGQLVNRADYPRLWNKIQSFGSSLVSDSLWNTGSVVVSGVTVLKPYRGCFSTGDGVNTFRLPDLRDTHLKGTKGTTDLNRPHNHAGGYQAPQVGEFQFTLTGYLDRKSGTADNIYVLNQRGPGSTPEDYSYTINQGKINEVGNVGIIYTVKI